MEISVIITNYNYKKYLSRCLRSALNQSFNIQEMEIIVIDDASTDGSQSIIRSFEGVKWIFNKQNIGLAESCNVAIQSAKGKYFVRLDADDYAAKDWLLILHAFASNNKADMNAVSCDYLEVDINEQTLRRKNGMTWPVACSVLFKTDDFLQLGGYNVDVPREDIEFRERFLRSGRQIYNIPVPLYRYTQHENSITKGL